MRSAGDNVQTALNNLLNSLGFATVVWDGVSIEDPAILWIRPTFLPAVPSDVSDKLEQGSSWQIGVYQVDVFAPLGQGSGPARDAAGVIEAGFARGTLATWQGTTVQVGRTYQGIGSRTGAGGNQDPDAPFFHIPVRVEWFASF